MSRKPVRKKTARKQLNPLHFGIKIAEMMSPLSASTQSTATNNDSLRSGAGFTGTGAGFTGTGLNLNNGGGLGAAHSNDLGLGTIGNNNNNGRWSSLMRGGNQVDSVSLYSPQSQNGQAASNQNYSDAAAIYNTPVTNLLGQASADQFGQPNSSPFSPPDSRPLQTPAPSPVPLVPNSTQQPTAASSSTATDFGRQVRDAVMPSNTTLPDSFFAKKPSAYESVLPLSQPNNQFAPSVDFSTLPPQTQQMLMRQSKQMRDGDWYYLSNLTNIPPELQHALAAYGDPTKTEFEVDSPSDREDVATYGPLNGRRHLLNNATADENGLPVMPYGWSGEKFSPREMAIWKELQLQRASLKTRQEQQAADSNAGWNDFWGRQGRRIGGDTGEWLGRGLSDNVLYPLGYQLADKSEKAWAPARIGLQGLSAAIDYNVMAPATRAIGALPFTNDEQWESAAKGWQEEAAKKQYYAGTAAENMFSNGQLPTGDNVSLDPYSYRTRMIQGSNNPMESYLSDTERQQAPGVSTPLLSAARVSQGVSDAAGQAIPATAALAFIPGMNPAVSKLVPASTAGQVGAATLGAAGVGTGLYQASQAETPQELQLAGHNMLNLGMAGIGLGGLAGTAAGRGLSSLDAALRPRANPNPVSPWAALGGPPTPGSELYPSYLASAAAAEKAIPAAASAAEGLPASLAPAVAGATGAVDDVVAGTAGAAGAAGGTQARTLLSRLDNPAVGIGAQTVNDLGQPNPYHTLPTQRDNADWTMAPTQNPMLQEEAENARRTGTNLGGFDMERIPEPFLPHAAQVNIPTGAGQLGSNYEYLPATDENGEVVDGVGMPTIMRADFYKWMAGDGVYRGPDNKPGAVETQATAAGDEAYNATLEETGSEQAALYAKSDAYKGAYVDAYHAHRETKYNESLAQLEDYIRRPDADPETTQELALSTVEHLVASKPDGDITVDGAIAFLNEQLHGQQSAPQTESAQTTSPTTAAQTGTQAETTSNQTVAPNAVSQQPNGESVSVGGGLSEAATTETTTPGQHFEARARQTALEDAERNAPPEARQDPQAFGAYIGQAMDTFNNLPPEAKAAIGIGLPVALAGMLFGGGGMGGMLMSLLGIGAVAGGAAYGGLLGEDAQKFVGQYVPQGTRGLGGLMAQAGGALGYKMPTGPVDLSRLRGDDALGNLEREVGDRINTAAGNAITGAASDAVDSARRGLRDTASWLTGGAVAPAEPVRPKPSSRDADIAAAHAELGKLDQLQQLVNLPDAAAIPLMMHYDPSIQDSTEARQMLQNARLIAAAANDPKSTLGGHIATIRRVLPQKKEGSYALKIARCWKGYAPVPGKAPYSENSCRPVRKKKKRKVTA